MNDLWRQIVEEEIYKSKSWHILLDIICYHEVSVELKYDQPEKSGWSGLKVSVELKYDQPEKSG